MQYQNIIKVTKKTRFCPFKNSYLNFILFYFISIETPKTCNMQDLLGNLVRLFLSCFWLMQSIRLDIDPKLICSYLFYLHLKNIQQHHPPQLIISHGWPKSRWYAWPTNCTLKAKAVYQSRLVLSNSINLTKHEILNKNKLN